MLRTVAVAATVAAFTFAPVASAGITCGTDAAAEIAGANVNGPRAGWDPPVWTFDMPDLATSVDVQAYTQSDAASKAQTWLQGQVDSACAAAQPAPPPAPPATTTTDTTTTAAPTASPSTSDGTSAPTTTTTDQTAAAQTLVDAATVTYVGNSWGPIPLYRVELPSLSLSIDVAATSADAARAAVVPMVATRLGGTPQTPTAPASAPVTTTQQAVTVAPTVDATPTPTPVTTAGVTTTPVAVEKLLTPTLDPAIRAALLAATG